MEKVPVPTEPVPWVPLSWAVRTSLRLASKDGPPCKLQLKSHLLQEALPSSSSK